MCDYNKKNVFINYYVNNVFYTENSLLEHDMINDTDPQDGLAVLNAALTLNSLLAKARSQDAAKAVEAQQQALSREQSSATTGTQEQQDPNIHSDDSTDNNRTNDVSMH